MSNRRRNGGSYAPTPKGTPVMTPPPAPPIDSLSIFEQALERSEKAQKTADVEKRAKRHPALVTADRLLEAARLYADRLTPAEVKALQLTHHALTEVGGHKR